MTLGQLGEARLDTAIDADLAGPVAHARALDVDAAGALRNIHYRVGTTILFECSGGQFDKVAHLPELRFALGEPDVDTTTVDSAATALEARGFFVRKIGTDGYRLHHQATLRKVVSDRQASLDEETDIQPATRRLVEGAFKQGATLPVVNFPNDSAAVPDSPRLALIVLDPESEWRSGDPIVERTGLWTKERGQSPRLYPGSLVWCARKPGRELRDRVALWLAWQRVAREEREGVLGAELERAERVGVQTMLREAEDAARDEVWASYRFVALSDAPGATRDPDHRPGGWPQQRRRDPLRADCRRPEVRGPAQRDRGRRLHRPPLAAGIQRHRSLAAHKPAAELPGWLIDAADES